jgi:hypothetical protein
MRRCRFCGAWLLFDKVRNGEDFYCNQEHLALGKAVALISPDEVSKWAREVHEGPCSLCGEKGGVDLRSSYEVYSIVFMTVWKTVPYVCCRRCGLKKQVGSLLFSLFLGWWGFPFGLVLTPIQIIRNLVAMTVAPDPTVPSKKLEQVGLTELANQSVAETARVG